MSSATFDKKYTLKNHSTSCKGSNKRYGNCEMTAPCGDKHACKRRNKCIDADLLSIFHKFQNYCIFFK